MLDLVPPKVISQREEDLKDQLADKDALIWTLEQVIEVLERKLAKYEKEKS